MHVYRNSLAIAFGWLVVVNMVHAGFDHVVTFDESGIWNRNVQQAIEYGAIAAELTGAFWLGGDDPLGKTFWKAMDSSALGAISSEAMKHSKWRSDARHIRGYTLYIRIRPRPSSRLWTCAITRV